MSSTTRLGFGLGAVALTGVLTSCTPVQAIYATQVDGALVVKICDAAVVDRISMSVERPSSSGGSELVEVWAVRGERTELDAGEPIVVGDTPAGFEVRDPWDDGEVMANERVTIAVEDLAVFAYVISVVPSELESGGWIGQDGRVAASDPCPAG